MCHGLEPVGPQHFVASTNRSRFGFSQRPMISSVEPYWPFGAPSG
ncbi:unannotated protein [freshwater metagenome]